MAPPNLLTIPIELRVKIYAIAGLRTTPFSSDKDSEKCYGIGYYASCYLRCEAKPPFLPLLRTCHQLYYEAADIRRSHEHLHV